MSRDDIIRMAHEAGLCEANGKDDDSIDISHQLERFFRLAYAAGAAAEREACANFVEEKFDFCGDELTAADAIRERGQK
jgi:hypothetical protein